MVHLRINGRAETFDGDPEMPLLWYLRDILGLTGSKFGCGMGLCGACTVLQNGTAIRSCRKQMGTTEGPRDHHHRSHLEQRPARRAKSLGRSQRAAMRILPARTNHAGRLAALDEAASD